MAFGFECKRCKHTSSVHDMARVYADCGYYPAANHRYVSPAPFAELLLRIKQWLGFEVLGQ